MGPVRARNAGGLSGCRARTREPRCGGPIRVRMRVFEMPRTADAVLAALDMNALRRIVTQQLVNEIPSTTRHAVLMAATEMLWRTVNGQT